MAKPPAAQATQIATGTANVQGLAAQGGRRLMGYHVRETAGATAACRLYHGTDATGEELAAESLAANGRERQWFGPDGIAVPKGVYIERPSGSTKVTLFWRYEL